MKLFDLSGKSAVVVGGAGGLGQAIAQGLAEAGAKVLISSRKEDSLKKAQEEIKAAAGVDVFYSMADATNEAQVECLLEDAKKKFVGKNPRIFALPKTFKSGAVHLGLK